MGFIAWLALVLLFTPRIDYHVTTPIRPDSDDFLHVIQSTCQAAIHFGNKVDIFTNGAQFYPVMRDAVLAAESSIDMEAYIFQPGEVGDMLIDAMVDRARAGVEVRIVMDAIGSVGMGGRSARRLREAGCKLNFYQPIRWYRLHRLNNRTHRELLVIDGRVAFTGGAGIADRWFTPHRGKPAWRDTMARIEGPIVGEIEGIVAENWLECTGEIFTGPESFERPAPVGSSAALAVTSSPADRATSSRVLFQTLVEGANRQIRIATPYFLPDKPFRDAIVRTARRGVDIDVIVPGPATDQRW